MSRSQSAQLSFKELLQASMKDSKAKNEEALRSQEADFYSGQTLSFTELPFDIEFRPKPQAKANSLYVAKMRELKLQRQEHQRKIEALREARLKAERLALPPECREAFEVFELHGCKTLELSNLLGRLKSEYRAIAKKIHPDRFTSPKAKAKAHHEFIKLQLAYHTLIKLI